MNNKKNPFKVAIVDLSAPIDLTKVKTTKQILDEMTESELKILNELCEKEGIV